MFQMSVCLSLRDGMGVRKYNTDIWPALNCIANLTTTILYFLTQDNIDAEVDTELKESIQNALGEHAEASGDESDGDINIDDVPEEDMNNLDKILAKHFKAMGKLFPFCF